MSVEGIDVSKWQSTTPNLAGLSFLFARASIGTETDEKYAMHIANARQAGLLVGAYHFNHGPISVASQVQAFLAAAGDVDFYALDVEGAYAFSLAQSKDFIARVQATGRKIGMYHSASGFPDAGQDYDWIAKWSTTPPSRAWTFWQYRGSPLDLDRFDGTLAQLRALARHTEDGMKFIKAVSGKVLRLPAGTDLFNFEGARETEVPATPASRIYPFIGSVDGVAGQNAILVPTGSVYVDGATRPTWLLAKAGTIEDAPAVIPPEDTSPFTQADIDAARLAGEQAGYDAARASATIDDPSPPAIIWPPRP